MLASHCIGNIPIVCKPRGDHLFGGGAMLKHGGDSSGAVEWWALALIPCENMNTMDIG